MEDLVCSSAADLARKIASRAVSAHEVASAFLDRIAQYNPSVNAIVSIPDDVLNKAKLLDQRLAQGGSPRPLEGVPFVVKDNIDARGLHTTHGSVIYKDNLPAENSVVVQRMLDAGGILIGKSNTSEFATDINTSNSLFGTTRNPLDLNVSAGGSSGGTAAAIAAGFSPIGLGTDRGGSIRIPAAWCGVSGLRPAPGRVPIYPDEFAWDTLVNHVQGPMARSVEDLGLLLSVLAGPDDRDPISLPRTAADYEKAALGRVDLKGVRIAFCADLGGIVPVDSQVRQLAHDAALSFRALGCTVDDACFDARDLKTIITGTRGYGILARFGPLYQKHGDTLGSQLVGQLEDAFGLSLNSVAEAERMRTAYWHRILKLQEKYDFIMTPTIGATPFRLDQPLPTEIEGKPVENFYDIFLLVYAFSLVGLPAASVPCGLTSSGGPVGLQIVGRRQREDQVLNIAAHYMHANQELFAPRPIDLARLVPLGSSVSTPGMRY